MGFVSNYRTYFLILFSKKVSDLISSKFKLEGLLLLSCPPHNFKSNIFTLLWFAAIMLVKSGWSFIRNQIHLGLLGLGWTHILIHLWPTWTWPNIILGLTQPNSIGFWFGQSALLYTNFSLANPAAITIALTRWRPWWRHLGEDWWMMSLHCTIFEAAARLLESIFWDNNFRTNFEATLGSTLGTTLGTSVTFNSKSVIL